MQNNNKMHGKKFQLQKQARGWNWLGVLPLDEVLKVNLSDMLPQP